MSDDGALHEVAKVASPEPESPSLCGDSDVGVNGAGSGRVFYEFSRPLGSPGATADPKEDLNTAASASVGECREQRKGDAAGLVA